MMSYPAMITLDELPSTKPKPNVVSSPFLRTAAVMAVVVYIDILNIFATSNNLGVENLGKYPYFVWAVASYVYIRLTTKHRIYGVTAQFMLLILIPVALTPFSWQLLTGAEPSSFASAFAAPLVYSASGVFDISQYSHDTELLRQRLKHLLTLLCILYVTELTIRRFSGIPFFDNPINAENHIKSLVLVAAICFACLEKDRRMLMSAAILCAVSLILRPSTTVVLATIICLPLSFAVRYSRVALAERATYCIIIFSAAVPLVLYAFPEVETAIINAEAWIKEDVLQGQSNTLVRLAIQNMAYARLEDSSIWVGEMFTGPNTVMIMHILPWWRENNPLGFATIHSDFVTILVQGGLLGYAWFTGALLLAVRSSFRAVRHAIAMGKNPSLPAIVHTAVLIVTIYCSSNPVLQYFGVSHVAWLIMSVGAIGGRMLEARESTYSIQARPSGRSTSQAIQAVHSQSL